MDEDDDYNTKCPICFEEYLCPKLLACTHTFCLSCLEECHRRSNIPDRTDTIRCPICQTLCVVPNGELGNLLTNHFVPDRAYTKDKHCDICQEAIMNDDSICQTCIKADEELELDTEEVTYLPANTALPISMYTRYIADLSWKCCIGNRDCHSDEQDLTSMVTCLCPTKDRELYAVTYFGPTFTQISYSGEIVGARTLNPLNRIFKIVSRQDNSKLLLATDQHAILLMENHVLNIFISVVNSGMTLRDMSIFSDDSVVVVGKKITDSDTDNGIILTYDKYGKLLSQIEKPVNEFEPLFVAINPVTNCVCISNNALHSIDIFLRDLSPILTFNGFHPNHFLQQVYKLRPVSIDPFGICCSKNGNILFADMKLDCIYVLNSGAEFLGIIVTPAKERIGNYVLVEEADEEESLWIGHSNGDVTKLKISKYNNVME